MKISDIIKKVLPKRSSVIYDAGLQGIFGTWYADRKDFASLIYYNLCSILLDLADDVKIELDASQQGNKDVLYLFAAYRAFYYAWGRVVLQRLKDEGFVVIGWDGIRFWQMQTNEYTTIGEGSATVVVPNNREVQVYVMRDATFIIRGKSLLCSVRPWMDFLDDVCNGSSTVSKRLGAVVVGSPKTYSGAPTPTVLTEEQKKKIEADVQTQYGALRTQNQFMILPKEMAFQVVNLAGIDMKFTDKVRECVLAIADAIPVPANQVAIIDANASKALSNGSELHEGDKSKYKSFRRLFERTFVQMAMDFNLKISYAIDGEPIDAEVIAEGA